MAYERIYKCATPAAMARRATGDLFSDMVMQLVYSNDPHEVVVEVDTNGRIDPVTKKQVVVTLAIRMDDDLVLAGTEEPLHRCATITRAEEAQLLADAQEMLGQLGNLDE